MEYCKEIEIYNGRYYATRAQYDLYLDLSFQRTSRENVLDIPRCVTETWVIIPPCITVYLHENSVYFVGFEADQSLRITRSDV